MKKTVKMLMVASALAAPFVLTGCAGLFNGLGVFAQEPVREFPSIFLVSDDEVLVDRETWFPGTVSIVSPENPEHNITDVEADVRGRGNSTWWFGEDKRPLRFRFPADAPQGVLQFDYEARTWILLANHFDYSLMRNYTALHFGGQLEGMDWTPRVQNVHVYFNGEYLGVYTLTEERDLGPYRADLTLDDDPAISEFFLEMDGRANWDDARTWYDYVQVNHFLYDIRFPSGNRRSVEQGQYVSDFLYNVSDAIRSQDWQEINNWIDIPSFVDFYIVQELVKNIDLHWSSVFMQIRGQGEDRRLYMGPLWDFDQVAGSSMPWRSERDVQGVTSPYGIIGGEHYWFLNLMFVPEFMELLSERWEEVRNNELQSTLDRVDYLATNYLDEFERNFDRHPYLMGSAVIEETSYEMMEIDTFTGQIEFLLGWLEVRREWLSGFWYGWTNGYGTADLTDRSDDWLRGYYDSSWTPYYMLETREF